MNSVYLELVWLVRPAYIDRHLRDIVTLQDTQPAPALVRVEAIGVQEPLDKRMNVYEFRVPKLAMRGCSAVEGVNGLPFIMTVVMQSLFPAFGKVLGYIPMGA